MSKITGDIFGKNQPDPYADLDEVYAEETSPQRLRVTQTPKTPTEPTERDTDQGA